MNGTQLYGVARIAALARMSMHPAVRTSGLAKKLAMYDLMKEIKLTRLDGRIYSNTFTPPFPSAAYTRYLEALVATTRGEPTPLVTNFAVTAACPCRCWHCSFAARSPKGELTTGELVEAIAAAQRLGTSVIGFTGGEPLLRKDLEEIIAAVGEESTPLLFTTGFELSRERVRALKDAGLVMPVVSLDHYDREVHDRRRGRAGFYDYAVRAIELFKEEGFYVSVSFVPDKAMVDDEAELWKTLELFRRLEVNDLRLTSPILAGNLTDRRDEKLTEANVATLARLQRASVAEDGYPGVFGYDFFECEAHYGCVAGFGYQFVDSKGNVSPCDFTMLTMGNLREEPLEAIWQRMSGTFCRPGTTCYANRISDAIAALDDRTRPLGREDSRRITESVPPCDPARLPRFFRRMGLSG